MKLLISSAADDIGVGALVVIEVPEYLDPTDGSLNSYHIYTDNNGYEYFKDVRETWWYFHDFSHIPESFTLDKPTRDPEIGIDPELLPPSLRKFINK